MSETKETKGGFMTRLATFIVDKRNLFFLLTIILLIFPPSPATGWRWRANFPPICRRIP